MICTRCHGSMREHHYFDVERRDGFMWMKGWQCAACGDGANPLLEANRRLSRMMQAVRSGGDEPSGTMFSVLWRHGP
jgi:hypothetical protein